MANKSKGFLGDKNIGVFKLGDSDVRLYLGDTLVYPLNSNVFIVYDVATYNGMLQTAQNIIVTDESGNTLVENVDYVVTENNGGTNAGTYNLIITLMGQYQGTARTNFVINKVTPTVTAPTAKVLTYNTQAQELVNAGSTNYGTLKYSIDGTNYSTMIPSVTTAGSYTVYYKVDGDSNINDVAAQSIACSIAKASGSVTTAPTAKSLTYNGNSQELINAGSGTGTMMYKLDNGSWSTDIPSATTAGTYTVYYKASASTNYEESSSGSVNCVIAKADSSLSFTVTNLTVGIGETKTNAATVNAGDGTVTYVSSDPSIATVDNSGNVSGISSGNTTVSANISSTSNYKSATTSYNVACAIVVIAKFNVTSTSSPTRIASGTSNFTKIEIDGVVQPSVSTGYTFSTTGEHTVKYYLKSTSIGNNAFSACTSLTSIDIPDSVTSIGSAMCRDCTSLTTCTIGSGVTSIGNSAFYNCSGLTSIVIPDSVTTIGFNAFASCKGLTSINIPNSVKSIGGYAFQSCTGLTSIVIPSGVTSIGGYAFINCSGLTSIDIPDSVTSIGDWAFEYCSGLTSCTIGSGVTSIGKGTFYDCSGLTSIDIPDSVTSIGESAFTNCYSLSSCTIGSGVTSIGGYAFINCSGLTSIDIPNSVTSIGSHAFTSCSDLTSCTIGDGVTSIGNSAFYRCSGLTSIEIPDSVTTIGGSAFQRCTSLTSIDIPSGVTSIGGYAFYGCSGLTSITVEATTPPTFEEVLAFAVTNNCPIYVPCDSVDAYKSASGWSDYASRIEGFGCPYVVAKYNVTSTSSPTRIASGTSSFTAIEIDGVKQSSVTTGYTFDTIGEHTVKYYLKSTSIGNDAFRECSGLTSVIIPDTITSIGDNAFGYCSGLTSVTVEAITPPTLGGYSFDDTNNCPIYVPCDSVNAYKAANNWSTYASRIQCWDITAKYNVTSTSSPTKIASGTSNFSKIEIDGVVQSSVVSTYTFSTTGEHTVKYALKDPITIGNRAFYNCSRLTSIDISDSVTSIGSHAFDGCSGLTSCTIGSGVTSIGDGAFQACRNLTSIDIPDSVTSIGEATFRYCSGLTSIDIPNSVTSIGGSAFEACHNLTSIDIPNSVTSIGGYAFIYCYSLTSCTIGSGVTSIGDYAFTSCSGLTSIVIPNSVTSIGEGAFTSCSDLTSIVIPNSVTSIGNSAFNNCYSLTSCTIGSGVTSIGERAFYGCRSLTSCTIGDGVTSIGSNAFYDCSGLTSCTIGSGSIGSSAFYNCSSLTSCTIGDGVTSIGGSAFQGCSRLTSIDIPNSVTSIGGYAFWNCYSLTSCTIGSGVTTIGNYAFWNCYSLTSCTIGSSVTSVGSSAFYNCSSLTSITSKAYTAPTIQSNTFQNVKTGGTLTVPSGSSGYDVWMGTGDYYLGYYNWTKVEQ